MSMESFGGISGKYTILAQEKSAALARFDTPAMQRAEELFAEWQAEVFWGIDSEASREACWDACQLVMEEIALALYMLQANSPPQIAAYPPAS